MQVPNQTKYAGAPTEEATILRRGTTRALAALPLPADAVLSPSPSRPGGVVEAATKERDAVGRSAQEGRRLDPARGGAVLASAAKRSDPGIRHARGSRAALGRFAALAMTGRAARRMP